MCQSVVLIALAGALDVLLLITGCLLVVALAVLGLGEPQAALVQGRLVIVAHGNGLLEVFVGLLGAVVGQRLDTHVIEDGLLGLEHLGTGLLDAVDAGEGTLVIGGVHVGIDQVALHIVFITRVGVLVEEVLKQVHTLVERGACTLAHADGIVVVGRLLDVLVIVHHCCLLECHVGGVDVVELTLGLAQVQVGALCQRITAVGHMQHVVDHGLIVAVAIVEHAHGIGRGAVRFALGVVEIAAQIGARLAVIAQMIVALAHQAVELGIEVVVAVLIEQGLTLIDDIAIMFLVILDLGQIVLRLETQFTVLRDAAELGACLIVVALGVIQISLIELAGTGIAAATVQLVVLALGLTVIAQAQVAVGPAVFQILIAVEVQRAVAHERIAQQRALPLAAVEVVVAHLHLGLHRQGRCGILLDETLQGG